MPRKKRATDEAVFLAVIDNVRRHGVGCPTDKIAKQAGLAGGPALFARFQTKERLIVEAFNYSRLSNLERDALICIPRNATAQDVVHVIADVLHTWSQRDFSLEAKPYITKAMRQSYWEEVVVIVRGVFQYRHPEASFSETDVKARTVLGALRFLQQEVEPDTPLTARSPLYLGLVDILNTILAD